MLSIKHLGALLICLSALSGSSAAGTHLSESVFTAIDVETTGLSPAKDRIIELSTVRFKGTNILELNSWLIDPGIPIPARSSQVHGITDAMVSGKPAFQEICGPLSQALSNSTVIAHNARFDWNFIEAEYRRAGLKPPGELVVDAIPLAREAFPGLKSYSLHSLAESLELGSSPTHRSEADTLTLVSLIQRSIDAMGKKSQSELLERMIIRPATPKAIPEKGLKQDAE